MSETGAYAAVAQRQFRRQAQSYNYRQSIADEKFIAFMVSSSGAGKNDRVLDVACGLGAATLAFAARCKRATGIDLAPDILARASAEAQSRSIDNAGFALSELENMAFADGAFTGAVCRFSFHHFVHPQRVFAEMARVVQAGCWMMISDTAASEDERKADFHNELERLCDPTHARALAPSEFERMFAKHGFSVIMKIARDARMSVDDWIAFGHPPANNIVRLRQLIETAVEGDKAGLKLTREGDSLRMGHTTVSFVVEKES
ncbi:MAG: class I SAM-dependent methyltransferase [Candidatus Binataceae bacterium]